jgi:hypothetical protein
MNLHDIAPSQIQVWSWLTPVGGNSRPLGPGQFQHAYLVERGAPPPINETNPYSPRRYWTPYGTFPEDALHPICGTIRSQARWPQLREYDWMANGPCPTCAETLRDRGLEAENLALVRNRDPWQLIERNARPTTIDPVSGR